MDKLTIQFPAQQLQHSLTPQQLDAYVRQVCAGDVFKIASTGGFNGNVTLATRRYSGSGNPQWLFNATVVFATTPLSGILTIKIDLDLNPIRFLAHRRAEYEAEDDTLPADLLRVKRRAREVAYRQTLDRTDNFISGEQALRSAGATDWPALLTYYLGNVLALIEQELSPASINSHPVPPERGRWVLRYLETVWEFEERDALATLGAVEEAVRRVRGGYQVHQHNSGRSIRFDLLRDVEVAIYAKALTRLRIEVRHKRRIRNVYSRTAPTAIYPDNGLQNLAPFVAFINEQASSRLSRLFPRERFLEIASAERRSPLALATFADEVFSACGGDNQKSTELLAALYGEGRYSETTWLDLRQECEALVTRHVLVRERSAGRERLRTYSVHPHYRRMLAAIRAVFDGDV